MALTLKPIKAIKIHSINEDHDDGDPLYEVEATITYKDGLKKRYTFEWVRAGHLHALKHPKSRDPEMQEFLEYLIAGTLDEIESD